MLRYILWGVPIGGGGSVAATCLETWLGGSAVHSEDSHSTEGWLKQNSQDLETDKGKWQMGVRGIFFGCFGRLVVVVMFRYSGPWSII